MTIFVINWSKLDGGYVAAQTESVRVALVTVTGPRQSGKTTLCRAAFPGLPHVDLDAPDERKFAESDPRGFLARFPQGAILDEIQRVPDLLSYLKVLADEDGGAGLFILTGSEQFRLSETIGQSLAGRRRARRGTPATPVSDRLVAVLHPRDFECLAIGVGWPDPSA